MASPTILHIDTGKTFRGGQRQLLLLSQRLQGMDFRQVIACPQNSELAQRTKNISTKHLSNYSLIRKISTKSLSRIIDDYGINIVHAHDSEAHTLGILLKRQYPGMKLVVTRRVVFPASSAVSRRIKYRKYVDRFIAISRAVAKSLVKIGVNMDKISVIPSALDIHQIRNTTPDVAVRETIPGECKFLIVSAGALTKEKDFTTAVRSVTSVMEKVPGVGFLILGQGPERDSLQALIDESDSEKIILLGHREPMASFFKACDLFLLTSVSEGLNSSAIEAAACGLPLVVSNVGGLPEIAEHEYNGVLCEPGRPDMFAKAIIDLLGDEPVRKRMAENSARKSEQFDIKPAAQKTADLYNRILAE